MATGGSVVRELLKDKQWHVRAVTRNIASSKAKALESEGAEVVYADLDKPETLASAVEVRSFLLLSVGNNDLQLLIFPTGRRGGVWRDRLLAIH